MPPDDTPQAADGPRSDDYYYQALRDSKPSWQADGGGVRGNPVELHKEQAQTNWPESSFVSRGTQIHPVEPPVSNSDRTEINRVVTSDIALGN